MRMASIAMAAALAGCGGGDDALEQHEVTAAGDLLAADGTLREPGWSSRQVQRWNPERVAEPARLRRWDFFSLIAPDAAVNVTMTDLGFLQLATVGVVDRTDQTSHTGGALEMNASLLELSAAVDGDARFTPSGAQAPGMTFTTTRSADEVTTHLDVDLPASLLGEAVRASLVVHRRATLPYLSLATPFREDPHDFFFEQKVHGMTGEGSVTIGERTWTFDAAATTAIMDWGRGQWPGAVTWRWAGGADLANRVAFNLGDGFGDDRAGTENLVVVGDVAHKLGRVTFAHDAAAPLADWHATSADGRVALTLHPDTPEANDLDLGERFEHLRKVYGAWTGTIVLDDGTTTLVHAVPGFAEEMHLAW